MMSVRKPKSIFNIVTNKHFNTKQTENTPLFILYLKHIHISRPSHDMLVCNFYSAWIHCAYFVYILFVYIIV